MAFVWSVMVGREGLHRDTLIDIARAAGERDVLSHLSTGNLTFYTSDASPRTHTKYLEAGVGRVIGREEMVAIRALPWLAKRVKSNPFLGLDPAEWGFEVAFLRHDAYRLEPSDLTDAQRTVLPRLGDRELFAARPTQGGQRPHVNSPL